MKLSVCFDYEKHSAKQTKCLNPSDTIILFRKKLTFLTASKRSRKKNSSKQWPAAHLKQNYMFPFPHTFSSTFSKIAKSHLKMNWKVEAELFKNSLQKFAVERKKIDDFSCSFSSREL
ncbi:hypothetical protein CDAR_216231 [Caerostris darwini]|uniref:Uncharacterized protein n=1 Tax=Caerostris darwini TaxID=1538125 RepID=A0AAV4SP12_9ARAC|nr:hypothetical protein CDAR_216231 [Caerostris darwini]